jgi:membrane associated rhomboid family serine protease
MRLLKTYDSINVPIGTTFLAVALIISYFVLAGSAFYIDSPSLELLSVSRSLPAPGLLSHLFVHVGLEHLVGNIIPLIAFGLLLELESSALELLLVFFFSGLAGGVAFIALNPSSALAGASAGVSGLMGAAVMLAPRRTLLFVAAIMPLLVYILLLPALRYGVELQDSNAREQAQYYAEQASAFSKQGQYAQAEDALSRQRQALIQSDAISSGRQRESQAPSDLAVHLVGAVLGAAVIYGLRPAQASKRASEFSNWLISAVWGRK